MAYWLEMLQYFEVEWSSEVSFGLVGERFDLLGEDQSLHHSAKLSALSAVAQPKILLAQLEDSGLAHR